MYYVRYILIIVLMLLFVAKGFSQELSPEHEKIRETGLELIEQEEYKKAMQKFSQLVSLYPKNHEFNFYFSVCLVQENEKFDQAVRLLKYAAKSQDMYAAFYYLGLINHRLYKFDVAIDFYKKFQAKADKKALKIYPVEQQIKMCENGRSLLKYLSELNVLDNKIIKNRDFYYSYELNDFGGKILVKPEEFMFKLDKKEKRRAGNKPIMLLSAEKDMVYMSSYGKKGDTGKDIYRVMKNTATGEWDEPQRLSDKINTPYDEAYPFIHPNGTTLYFCSKGHNSMGGYDIFKAEFDWATETWSEPENMDFPINSPYDDILYISDAKEELAYFASNRETNNERISVYRIQVDKNPQKKEIENYEEIIKKSKLEVTPLLTMEAPGDEVDENNEELKLDKSLINDNSDELAFEEESVNFEPIEVTENMTKDDVWEIASTDFKKIEKQIAADRQKSNLAYLEADNSNKKAKESNDKIQDLYKKLNNAGSEEDKKQIKEQIAEETQNLKRYEKQAVYAHTLARNLESAVNKKEQISKEIKQLADNIQAGSNPVPLLVEQVNNQRKKITETQKSSSTIEELLADVEQELPKLEQQYNSQKKKLEDIKQEISQLKQDKNNLEVKLDNAKDAAEERQVKSKQRGLDIILKNEEREARTALFDLSKTKILIDEKKGEKDFLASINSQFDEIESNPEIDNKIASLDRIELNDEIKEKEKKFVDDFDNEEVTTIAQLIASEENINIDIEEEKEIKTEEELILENQEIEANVEMLKSNENYAQTLKEATRLQNNADSLNYLVRQKQTQLDRTYDDAGKNELRAEIAKLEQEAQKQTEDAEAKFIEANELSDTYIALNTENSSSESNESIENSNDELTADNESVEETPENTKNEELVAKNNESSEELLKEQNNEAVSDEITENSADVQSKSSYSLDELLSENPVYKENKADLKDDRVLNEYLSKANKAKNIADSLNTLIAEKQANLSNINNNAQVKQEKERIQNYQNIANFKEEEAEKEYDKAKEYTNNLLAAKGINTDKNTEENVVAADIGEKEQQEENFYSDKQLIVLNNNKEYQSIKSNKERLVQETDSLKDVVAQYEEQLSQTDSRREQKKIQEKLNEARFEYQTKSNELATTRRELSVKEEDLLAESSDSGLSNLLEASGVEVEETESQDENLTAENIEETAEESGQETDPVETVEEENQEENLTAGNTEESTNETISETEESDSQNENLTAENAEETIEESGQETDPVETVEEESQEENLTAGNTAESTNETINETEESDSQDEELTAENVEETTEESGAETDPDETVEEENQEENLTTENTAESTNETISETEESDSQNEDLTAENVEETTEESGTETDPVETVEEENQEENLTAGNTAESTNETINETEETGSQNEDLTAENVEETTVESETETDPVETVEEESQEENLTAENIEESTNETISETEETGSQNENLTAENAEETTVESETETEPVETVEEENQEENLTTENTAESTNETISETEESDSQNEDLTAENVEETTEESGTETDPVETVEEENQEENLTAGNTAESTNETISETEETGSQNEDLTAENVEETTEESGTETKPVETVEEEGQSENLTAENIEESTNETINETEETGSQNENLTAENAEETIEESGQETDPDETVEEENQSENLTAENIEESTNETISETEETDTQEEELTTENSSEIINKNLSPENQQIEEDKAFLLENDNYEAVISKANQLSEKADSLDYQIRLKENELAQAQDENLKEQIESELLSMRSESESVRNESEKLYIEAGATGEELLAEKQQVQTEQDEQNVEQSSLEEAPQAVVELEDFVPQSFDNDGARQNYIVEEQDNAKQLKETVEEKSLSITNLSKQAEQASTIQEKEQISNQISEVIEESKKDLSNSYVSELKSGQVEYDLMTKQYEDMQELPQVNAQNEAIAEEYVSDAKYFNDLAEEARIESYKSTNDDKRLHELNKAANFRKLANRSMKAAMDVKLETEPVNFVSATQLLSPEDDRVYNKLMLAEQISGLRDRQIAESFSMSEDDVASLNKSKTIQQESEVKNIEIEKIADKIFDLEGKLQRSENKKEQKELEKQIEELTIQKSQKQEEVTEMLREANELKYSAYKNYTTKIPTYSPDRRMQKVNNMLNRGEAYFEEATRLRAKAVDASGNQKRELNYHASELELLALNTVEQALYEYGNIPDEVIAQAQQREVELEPEYNKEDVRDAVMQKILVKKSNQELMATIESKEAGKVKYDEKINKFETRVEAFKKEAENAESEGQARKYRKKATKMQRKADKKAIKKAAITQEENEMKFNMYKRNVAVVRSQDVESLEAVQGKEAEQVAMQTYKRAQLLRGKAEDAGSKREAVINLEQAANLEAQAMEQMEKAYGIYMGLVPVVEPPVDSSLIVRNDLIVKPTFISDDELYSDTKEEELLGFNFDEEVTYTEENPIPVNVELPEGIYYKVQIGAFVNPIPQNTFKGITPVTAEEIEGSRFTKYLVGLFRSEDAASYAKNEIRNKGYRDAFVVAYKDGKRIMLYQARNEHENADEQTKQEYDLMAQKELDNLKAAIVGGEDLAVSTNNSSENTQTDNQEQLAQTVSDIVESEQTIEATKLSDVSGLMFTIQIGVYSKPVTKKQLKNLDPIYVDRIGNLYKYTTGIFTDYISAVEQKDVIVRKGITDAFVIAYYNGKKISVKRANILLQTQGASVLAKSNEPQNIEDVTTQTYGDVVFRVQIGAYSEQVPSEVLASYIDIASKYGLDQTKANGLTYYTVGNLKSYKEAVDLKQRLAVEGISDAFLVAYQGSDRIKVSEALRLIRQKGQ